MDNDPCVCSMSDILQIRAGRITRYSCRALRIKLPSFYRCWFSALLQACGETWEYSQGTAEA